MNPQKKGRHRGGRKGYHRRGAGSGVRLPDSGVAGRYAHFGRTTRDGYILSFAESSDYPGKLREIIKVSTTRAHVPEHLVELGRWMADYYCCSQEQSIRTLLPAAVRSGKVKPKKIKVYRIGDRQAAEQFLRDNETKPSAALRTGLIQLLLPGKPLTSATPRCTPCSGTESSRPTKSPSGETSSATPG